MYLLQARGQATHRGVWVSPVLLTHTWNETDCKWDLPCEVQGCSERLSLMETPSVRCTEEMRIISLPALRKILLYAVTAMLPFPKSPQHQEPRCCGDKQLDFTASYRKSRAMRREAVHNQPAAQHFPTLGQWLKPGLLRKAFPQTGVAHTQIMPMYLRCGKSFTFLCVPQFSPAALRSWLESGVS